MRRIAILLTAFVATVGAAGAPAWAFAPGGSPAAPSAIAGEHVCTVSDRRVFELSGLAATAAGYVAINDSASDPADIHIFRFDNACRTQQVLAYPSAARDPEDLALGADGTVWVADIGDNDRNRTTVAIWKLAPRSTRPVIHRLTYPDGPHDAEALFVVDAGLFIITKDDVGVMYRLPQPLSSKEPMTLERVGTLGLRKVTDADASPDGRVVAVRTNNEVVFYRATDLTNGGPIPHGIRTSLRTLGEPQGEGVALAGNGEVYLASEGAGRAGRLTSLRCTLP